MLVHDDAVVDVEPGILGEHVDYRGNAYPDDDDVGGELGAVIESDGRDAPVASTICDADPEVQVDAVVTVQVSEDLRHLRPQDAQQWQLELLDDHDVVARFPTGGRRLQSDPSRHR